MGATWNRIGERPRPSVIMHGPPGATGSMMVAGAIGYRGQVPSDWWGALCLLLWVCSSAAIFLAAVSVQMFIISTRRRGLRDGRDANSIIGKGVVVVVGAVDRK